MRIREINALESGFIKRSIEAHEARANQLYSLGESSRDLAKAHVDRALTLAFELRDRQLAAEGRPPGGRRRVLLITELPAGQTVRLPRIK